MIAIGGSSSSGGVDLLAGEGLADLRRGLPAVLAARDEVRGVLYVENHLAAELLDQPAQRHALECLLGEVSHDARQADLAPRQQAPASLPEHGKDGGRRARAARGRLEGVAISRRVRIKCGVRLRELPREQLQPVVELVAHKAACQAEVAKVAAPDVD